MECNVIRYKNIDEAYASFEKRFDLKNIASESGIEIEDYNALSVKDRCITLGYKLKETSRVHLASFLFEKAFEITSDVEALLNKIDCLIILGEFEEAYRYNCMGYELYLEDMSVEPLEVEKVLSYQKAIIYFSSEKLDFAEVICEENIIKFEQKESYILLTAVFIASKDYSKAMRIFTRYASKAESQEDFLADVIILLLTIAKNESLADFLMILLDKDKSEKAAMKSYLNNFHLASRNRELLKNYLSEQFELSSEKQKV